MKTSVIVPSKGCRYLEYLLWGLRNQIVRPYELVLVLKDCNIKYVDHLCEEYGLPCITVVQTQGYFTHALNIGKKETKGDLLIFTDEDAIPLPKWIKRYIELHIKYRDVAAICSRDIFINTQSLKLKLIPDDYIQVKLYRWLIRPWLEQPHSLLKKYRMGVYITKRYTVAHGPCIPDRTCYSLPFRGVNMSFKSNYVYDVWFPEHKLIRRAPGNEQYFGLQLVLKGYDSLYIPGNPVLHIVRQSLSRGHRDEIRRELKIMRALFAEILT